MSQKQGNDVINTETMTQDDVINTIFAKVMTSETGNDVINTSFAHAMT
jgi:hypothetical protein